MHLYWITHCEWTGTRAHAWWSAPVREKCKKEKNNAFGGLVWKKMTCMNWRIWPLQCISLDCTFSLKEVRCLSPWTQAHRFLGCVHPNTHKTTRTGRGVSVVKTLGYWSEGQGSSSCTIRLLRMALNPLCSRCIVSWLTLHLIPAF